MKILTWEKFNESEKYDNELAFNNGIFALNLNFDISQFESIYQLKSKITTPYVTSNCENPFVFASKDKELLDELREFLNSLSKEEIEKIQFYSNSDRKLIYLSNFVPYSHNGICEIDKSDLSYQSKPNNNELYNDDLYNQCKKNMKKLPEGKVFSYFRLKKRKPELDKYGDFIEVGVDVTEELKNFLVEIKAKREEDRNRNGSTG